MFTRQDERVDHQGVEKLSASVPTAWLPVLSLCGRIKHFLTGWVHWGSVLCTDKHSHAIQCLFTLTASVNKSPETYFAEMLLRCFDDRSGGWKKWADSGCLLKEQQRILNSMEWYGEAEGVASKHSTTFLYKVREAVASWLQRPWSDRLLHACLGEPMTPNCL